MPASVPVLEFICFSLIFENLFPCGGCSGILLRNARFKVLIFAILNKSLPNLISFIATATDLVQSLSTVVTGKLLSN